MTPFDAATSYLSDVLGVALTAAKPWDAEAQLPLMLAKRFEFQSVALAGHEVLLARGRLDDGASWDDLRVALVRVESVVARPVALVLDGIGAYDRRRLIELKLPFIVPGAQLYLPDLGMDLREQVRSARIAPTPTVLQPVSQALLIAALHRQPWEALVSASEIGAELGYSAMSASRAARELAGAGLATLHRTGRTQQLAFSATPEAVWQQARGLMRSPIIKSVWVRAISVSPAGRARMREAGLSALAHRSMLTPPRWPEWAVQQQDWRTAVMADVEVLPRPEPGAELLQIWSTPVGLDRSVPTVDGLSLTLALQHDPDERVQAALDELKEQLPWSRGSRSSENGLPDSPINTS